MENAEKCLQTAIRYFTAYFGNDNGMRSGLAVDNWKIIVAELNTRASTEEKGNNSFELFLLQVREAVECRVCSDREKINSIKLLISEQLRKAPLALKETEKGE